MSTAADLNLLDYWRILRRRKLLLMGAWGMTVGATWLFTQWQTPVYQARAVVKIEPSTNLQGLGLQSQWDVWALLSTEVKSVRSTTVALSAARLLGWVTDETSSDKALRIANAIQGQTQSDRQGDSNLIQVSVTSDDPQKAAAIANAVVQAYIEKGIEDRLSKMREINDFTFQELQKAEAKLRAAEDALRKYSEKSKSRGVGNYFTGQLINLQAELDELRKTYTEQHPEVRKIRDKIKAVQAQMRDLPQEETEYLRLAREVRNNEERYNLLFRKYQEAQLAEAERVQFAFIDSPALVPTTPIRPNKRLNLSIGLVVGFLLGVTAVLIMENLDTSIDTIEDVEKYLELPVLAVVPHIHPRDGAQGSSGFSFSLPRGDSLDDARRRMVIFHPTQSSFAEAYHTLRTNLRMNIKPGMRPGPVVGFTSAGISEGKTITGANFCLTAAQTGLKTLFIEADLRRPFIQKLLGIPREPGITDCILKDKPLMECTKNISDFLVGELGADRFLNFPGMENIRILPPGPPPLNPADVLGSQKFDQILSEARAQFDLVVVDCPPVMLFADALLIGPKTDGLVLVYKAGRTARGALKRAKDQLSNMRTKLLGVVLNDLRASDMEPHYGYQYYSYHYETPDKPK